MKGIELPLNTIIIMAVVVIVLLATASFFFKIWTPGVVQISGQQAFNTGCRYYADQYNCDIANTDAKDITIENYDGENLLVACRSLYGNDYTSHQCLRKCSCSMNKDADNDGIYDSEDNCPTTFDESNECAVD